MIEEAVRTELESLGATRREPSLCALALTLAERLDGAGARDSAPIANQLRETLTKIKAACKDQKQERGRLDDLAARRAARASGTADPEQPAEGE